MLNQVRKYGAVALVLALFSGALLAQSPPMGGYANATFTYGTTDNDYLNSVVIKQSGNTVLSNLATGPSGQPYNIFYSSVPAANLVPGVSVTIEGTITPSWPEYLCAWIDYNNDGDFADSGELLGYTGQISGGGTGTITFTPPSGIGGVRRLRIMCVYGTTGPQNPTGSYSYGENEDYLVNLGFAVSTESPLPTAAQSSTYSKTIQATNGTTPYTWGMPVTGLPAGITATQQGNDLLLSGTPTQTGTFTFTVNVTDSSSPAKNANKQFQLTVVPPPAAAPFLDTFTTDLGWQPGTTWSRGVCIPYSVSTTPVRAEPTTDATPTSTDNMILGDTRGGDYPTSLGTTYWAISPMVNCTNLSTVRLRFQRWLGCAIGSTAQIQVSNNGTSWTTVWSSTGGTSQTTISDTAWTLYQYDITSVAAGSATVQVRFGIGPTGTTPHVGWSIDDFEIFEPGPDLEVKEGGVTGTSITNNQAVGGLRDFGQVTMGVQSAPLTIALINNGSTSCTFSSFVKGGANPGDFYIQAGTMANPLPAGQSTTFTVQFFVGTSGTPGVKTANITIPHNAGGIAGQNFVINLRGEATSPGTGGFEAFEISATGNPIAHQQPATGTVRDFGSVLVGQQSAPLTIVISNPGPGTLTMTTPDMGGLWWNQFIVNATGFLTSLPQGQTTSFTVRFAPTSTGSKDAFVRVGNSKQGGPATFEIPVLGNGITSVPSFEPRVGSATGPVVGHNDPAAGTARDFGDQAVSAGPTTPLTIVINNPGGQALTLGMPTLGGANPGDFVLNTTGYSTNVQAGASTSFTVAFDPTSVGQKNAEISITHNDTTNTSPFLILVTGNGVTTFGIIEVRDGGAGGAVVPNPAPATGGFNFGNRAVGSGPSAAAVVHVTNNGTAAMTVNAPVFVPATSEFVLESTGFAGSLAVGQSRSFNIRFSPTSLGVKTAQVSFVHTGVGTSSPFRINVTGTGVPDAPIVEVREGSVTGQVVASGAPAQTGGGRDFGSIDVAAGPSTPSTIVIRNLGTQNLVLGTPTLTGPHAAQFSLTLGGFTTTVAPGANTQFNVGFDPSAVGVKDAVIEFTQSDTTQASPFLIPVKGMGTSPTGVVIATATLPNGDLGKAYPAIMLAASQGVGPYTWSTYNSALPRGLTLASSGLLDGVPSDTVGVFPVTIRVTDSTGGTNDKQFTITIAGTVIGKQAGGARGGGGGCAAAGAGMAPVALAILAVIGWRRRRRQ
ncbi:MAG: choice-of-anchor D domain-containing protein [Planctomycetes bacterium]|nr:choice-of-anchor D domain-containing protein [Planctomycetota bacterium]